MPMHEVVTAAVLGNWPIAVFAVAFLAAYAGGVALVCRFRAVPSVTVVVAVTAIVVGGLVGGGVTTGGIFTVIVFLLLGLRIVRLGFRDWTLPLGLSFLIGAVALGAETLIGASGDWGWGPALVVLIPVFFVASLAARAISTWTTNDADEVDDATRERSLRSGLLSLGWIPVAMLAGAILGVQGGILDRFGSLIAPIGDAFAAGLVWVFSQLARPVFWLVDRLGIDPEGARRVFARIQANARHAGVKARQQVGHPTLLGRLIGLALFGLLIWGLVRLIRRLRPEILGGATPPEPRPDVAIASTPLTDELDPGIAHTRRAPPADRVRRWYLETLSALGRAGLEKAPALTPAEFVPEVIEAYPGSADAFRALTRAYEDVRYGRLTLDAGALRRLDREHKSLLASIRRQPPRTPEP